MRPQGQLHVMLEGVASVSTTRARVRMLTPREAEVPWGFFFLMNIFLQKSSILWDRGNLYPATCPKSSVQVALLHSARSLLHTSSTSRV